MERIKKLEARGVIKSYHALLDAKRLGKDITAFISVSIGHQRYSDSFSSFMVGQRDVLECHHVTGEESFILKVKCNTTMSLEKLLAEIRSMEGVTHTVTKVVLSTLKETQTIEIDDANGPHARAEDEASASRKLASSRKSKVYDLQGENS